VSPLESPSSWEERSRAYRTDCRSVLFRSLPPSLNQYIHEWHLRKVIAALAPSHGNGHPRVLDIGAGYGRIATAVQQAFPGARITGIDAAFSFVALFRETTGGGAVHANARWLPFRSEAFDSVIIVTVLMYLDPAAVSDTLREIIRVLKPNGVCILIENNKTGTNFYTLFGLIPRIKSLFHRSGPETGGRFFAFGEIQRNLERLPATVLSMSGCPGFTVGLVPLFAAAKVSGKIAAGLLALVRWVDGRWDRFSRLSLYIAYTIRRNP
jgi:SAM-dependent methyltransferase